jgi:glycine cleavage system H protein
MSVILGALFFIAALATAAIINARRAPARVSRQPNEALEAAGLPPGLFLDTSHTWMHIRTNGTLRVGIDELISGLVGQPIQIELPSPGARVERGSPLITIRCEDEEQCLVLRSPVDGQVLEVNKELEQCPWLLSEDPYGLGWAVSLWSRDHQGAIAPLRLGATASGFLRRELQRAVDFLAAAAAPDGRVVLADGAAPLRGALQTLSPERWQEFQAAFLEPKGYEATQQ